MELTPLIFDSHEVNIHSDLYFYIHAHFISSITEVITAETTTQNKLIPEQIIIVWEFYEAKKLKTHS